MSTPDPTRPTLAELLQAAREYGCIRDETPGRPKPARRPSLREMSADPDYLAVKASLGEPLTAAERAILEAARSVGPLKPFAGSDRTNPAGGGEP